MSKDIDVVREMLNRAGVRFKERPSESDEAFLPKLQPGGTSLVTSDSGHGYFGFYAEFIFNPDGSLVTVAAWE